MDFLYKVEYSKSSRSECKQCCCKIDESSLRFGRLYQFEQIDAKSYAWFHSDCFFEENCPESSFDIESYENLRWNDQLEIKEKMKTKIFGTARIGYLNEESVCKKCVRKLEKNEIIIITNKYWMCHKCFVSSPIKNLLNSYEEMNGFSELHAMDQEELEQNYPITVDVYKEEEMHEQNKIMYKHYDHLDRELKIADLKNFLQINRQVLSTTRGRNNMLERLADMCTYGNFVCNYCDPDEINYSITKFGYRCNNYVGDYSMCHRITLEPKSKPFRIPKNLKNLNLNYVPRVRVFNTQPYLHKMNFFIGIETRNGRKELEKQIVKLGGTVVHQITFNTMAVISNEIDVKNGKKYIDTAKKENVFVISEDFVDEPFNVCGGAEFVILSKILCNWGLEPHARFSTVKHWPRYTTNTLKNGLIIEERSRLKTIAHVYSGEIRSEKHAYGVVLIKTSVQNGKNSYYKLQLLESDSEPRQYWLFRMWGRIGIEIEDPLTIRFDGNLDEAKEEFYKIYYEKTRNYFPTTTFAAVDGKYKLYSSDKVPISLEQIQGGQFEVSSNLSKPVKELVKLIFNQDIIEKTIMEIHIDTDKMPLGKITTGILKRARNYLIKIKTALNNKDKDWSLTVTDLTNQFYNIIPHNCGIAQPLVINNQISLQQKFEMLNELENIQFIHRIIHSPENFTIDYCYNKLQVEMQAVDKLSEDYKIIQEYVANGHGTTHNFTLDIVDMFHIKQENRYTRDLHNHKLLWHGSRSINFVKILPKGLLITPKEAASIQGDMFGNGIYFADVVSKSAGYCNVESQYEDKRGLLLLCDVALGDVHETIKPIKCLPNGKHTVKALGKMEPNPDGSKFLSNTEIPVGKLYTSNISHELNYNEAVVTLSKFDFDHVNTLSAMRTQTCRLHLQCAPMGKKQRTLWDQPETFFAQIMEYKHICLLK